MAHRSGGMTIRSLTEFKRETLALLKRMKKTGRGRLF